MIKFAIADIYQTLMLITSGNPASETSSRSINYYAHIYRNICSWIVTETIPRPQGKVGGAGFAARTCSARSEEVRHPCAFVRLSC